jgi:peptidoglycan/xylan/chitin deacetylase (PgdA/CDA1 family)
MVSHIAMTFDDGPSNNYTPLLLDIAADRGVKLTFFVIGSRVAGSPSLVRRQLADGHELGNHSWSHSRLTSLTEQQVTDDLTRANDCIEAITGFRTLLMRPPYGELTKSQKRLVCELGYRLVYWHIDSLDWLYRDPVRIAERILKGSRSRSIVLAHDVHSTTVEAMPRVFDTLLAGGTRFLTVSELLGLHADGSGA